MQTTIGDLITKAKGSRTIRAGATNDPKRRKNEYEQKGYTGIMYYAQTENMKEDEDRLLAVCPCMKNEQRKSNAKRASGYVYVIQS